MHISQDLESTSVESKSRLRVWYLKTFRGYDIVMTKSTPSVGSFGRINARRVWHLRKRDESG